jgi:hypothetical protein
MVFLHGERRIILSISRERECGCNAVNYNLGRELQKFSSNCCVASKAESGCVTKGYSERDGECELGEILWN